MVTSECAREVGKTLSPARPYGGSGTDIRSESLEIVRYIVQNIRPTE